MAHPLFLLAPTNLLDAKAPAASLQGIAAKARAEAGEAALAAPAPNNSCRNAHAFAKRWGLSWNIPFTYLDHFDSDGGKPCQIPYISLKSFVRFLLEKTPELVLGGHRDMDSGRNNLECFWNAYLKVHTSHVMKEPHPIRKPSNSLAFCLHGDEGRGLKKGNTCVISLETVLGLDMLAGVDAKPHQCDCCLDVPYAKRFRLKSGQAVPRSGIDTCELQVTNLKQNSFLTKFVVAVLPNKYYKKTDILERLLEIFSFELEELFQEGVCVNSQQWFVGFVGLKGDLKWYEKICNLTRCFNKQLKSGACMCHECLAGKPNLPFENADHVPPWSDSIYTERPWDSNNIPSVARIPFDMSVPNNKQEMMLRRDIFHNAKVGILRDFCGSAAILISQLRYFHEGRGHNKKDRLLERAHDHFKFFCRTLGKTPALHSFTPIFFNHPTAASFAWVNAKGSDVTLMVHWIQVMSAGFLANPLKPDHVEVLSEIRDCAASARKFLNITYSSHRLWLPRHCAATLYQEIHKFLELYNKLAFKTIYVHNATGFGMKSKFHLICHAKVELWNLLVQEPAIMWIPSPAMFACDMCEDVVGKLSRLSRRVSPKTPSKRTLELYCIKCKSVHKRFLQTHKVGKKQVRKR